MSKKVFVGGLAWATTDDKLREFFSQAGKVVSATVITDRMSGRSKGFGFVEYETEEEAQKAITELNGKELDGRKVAVNEARPMVPREQRFGGGGSFGGGRNDRGGRRDSR
ncbi:RNA-binding protein [Candidatus Roizmanbacteria bacterium]|nr:RNA-binding protein [Candidatus Roizmanbacteria bacterium]